MTINGYLGQLERELRLRRAPRTRLLAEVDEHLRDLAAELTALGRSGPDAESQAVERFGAPATVAARFAEVAAATTARRALRAAVVSLVGYGAVLWMFSTASPLIRDFPQGATSTFAFPIASLAAGVAVVLSLHGRRRVVPTSNVVAIARASVVTAIALVFAVMVEAAVALTRPAGVIVWSQARWLTLAFAAAGLAVVAAAAAAARASAQARGAAARSRAPDPGCSSASRRTRI